MTFLCCKLSLIETIMSRLEFVFIFCLFGFLPRLLGAVRITSLDVPKTAWDAITLNCRYDLEEEQLYAVKWYKDGTEFYRCFSDGSVQEFPLRDIKIYHENSAQIGSCFFELTALTERSGGEYTCEVSLDWPTFKTVYQTSRLQILQPSKIVQSKINEDTNLLLFSPTATIINGAQAISVTSVMKQLIVVVLYFISY